MYDGYKLKQNKLLKLPLDNISTSDYVKRFVDKRNRARGERRERTRGYERELEVYGIAFKLVMINILTILFNYAFSPYNLGNASLS